MICHDYKFIRIHIKKCGGRSFSKLFPQYLDTHDFLSSYQINCPKQYDEYFKWTIVRNPWDRLVSLYFYLQQECNFNGHPRTTHMNFERFVADLYFASLPQPAISIAKWSFESTPQIDYLKNVEGKVDLDYICYLPNIRHDFEVIKQKLDFPKSWSYPHYGKSKHDDYRSYYNHFTVDCISSMYEEEIKYFNFDFEDINKFDYAKRNSFESVSGRR